MSKQRLLRQVDATRGGVRGGGEGFATAQGTGAAPVISRPTAPVGLAVNGSAFIIYSGPTSTAGANLAWTQPPSAPPANTYELQWSTASTFTTPTTRNVGRETSVGIDGLPVSRTVPAETTTVYFRVRAVSAQGVPSNWSNTASAAMPADTAAPTAPTSLASAWSAITGDLSFSWTPSTSTNARDTRVRIYASNGGALLRETYSSAPRFVWTRAMQAADTSGAYDADVYLMLTTRSYGGVFSATSLTGTASLSAPAAPTSVTLTASFATLGITVAHASPSTVALYRYRIIQTGPSAPDVTFDSPSPVETYALSADATYQVGVRAVGVLGQLSAETLSSTVVADALTLAELRANATYTDSLGNSSTALKAALSDDNTTSGGVNYGGTTAWQWIQVARPVEDRYHAVTAGRFAMGSGSATFYVATSADAATWRWFAGPLTSVGTVYATLTEVANEVAAQAAGVSVTNANIVTRWYLPQFVDARFIRLYVRQPTVAMTLREFYPRRMVQTDDLQAESIQGIHLSADAIDGRTITGAIIQTAASGAREVMEFGSGFRTEDSGGNTLVQLTGASGLVIDADSAYAASRSIRFAFGTEETTHNRQGGIYDISHEVTSVLPGYIRLGTTNVTTTATAAVYISSAHSTYGTAVVVSGAGLRVGGPTGGTLSSGELSVSGAVTAGGSGANLHSFSRYDSGTTDSQVALAVGRSTSGTPSTFFGTDLQFQLQSSTGDTRASSIIRSLWANATDASRRGRGQLMSVDASGTRNCFYWSTDGSNPTISFYGNSPVARPTISGSRGGNAALADLLTELATLGLITDSTT